MTTNGTRRKWIEDHAYLEGVAGFQGLVDDALKDVATLSARPDWAAYAADRARGVPLLRSERTGLDAAAAVGDALARLAERVAAAELPDAIRAPARALAAALRSGPTERAQAARWVIEDGAADAAPGGDAGLLRHLGWSALAHVLAPVAAEVSALRDEQWERGDCPTCGAAPSMGLLVDDGTARARLLACGCCRTRWRFKRVACPFCGNEDARKLGVLEIDREPTLRLDVCDACQGYVKTYTGAGEEAFFLADWPTLHLDVLARDRGYERRGASLFEIDG
jgi:FdhE protein